MSSLSSSSRLLDILLKLPDVVKSDPQLYQGVRWILQVLEEVDEGCGSVIRAAREGSSSSSAAEKEGRKKRAMERAMKQIKSSATQFMMDAVSMEEGEEDDARVEGDSE